MANVALNTAGRIEVVESIDQQTKNAGEDIEAGQAIHENASGDFVLASAANAGAAAAPYISTRKARRGDAVTGIRVGVMNGWNLSALAFNAVLYLSDTPGAIADAAGTVAVILGRVTSARATLHGNTFDKIAKFVCPV